MGRIEPMTVEEIKRFLASYDVVNGGIVYHNWGRLILAWVEAEAKLRYWPKRWLIGHSLELYRNDVLAEIGWPKEEKDRQ